MWFVFYFHSSISLSTIFIISWFPTLCALITFLIVLQWKCENLLSEKHPKFTETSTPLDTFYSDLLLRQYCSVQFVTSKSNYKIELLIILIPQWFRNSHNVLINTRTGLKSHCFSLNMFECWENIDVFLLQSLMFPECLHVDISVTPVSLLSDPM